MVNKSLGQHWLKNRAILNKIAELASDDEGKLCVEIGPGLGTLTASLFRHFDKIIAVEYDEKLAKNLPGSFPGKNLEVVNADFLKCDLSELPRPYAIAGNIPYYITSPIIEKVISEENAPEKIVLLMQKEVAERVASEKETVLSLTVKNRADVSLGPVVPRDEFDPAPKVDSQVLILTPHEPLVKDEVLKLIKVAFAAPRKKVIKNLSSLRSVEDLKRVFAELDISENARPGDLHLADYAKINEKVI